MNLISKTSQAVALLIALAAASGLTACSDSFIFDYEGDCDPKFRVRFAYDWNMKFADAFANEVDHVTLNVIDPDGNIVHTHTESGDALAADGYEVVLDEAVKPGTYRLQAWCGSGAQPGNTSFAVHEASRLEHLKCTLLPDGASRAGDITGAEGTDVRRPLDNLYHGLTAEVEFPEDEGTHYFKVPLVKNTNSVKVVLQHLSGEPIDGNDFDFTITASNARMDHDNSLIESDPVVYHAWDIANGSAVITDEYSQTGTYSATVAEFTIGRLLTDDDVRHEARRKSDGQLCFSVSLIDMALLVKGNYNRGMSDQEYLDRQDDYNFIFFLDANYRWIEKYIYIQSWKVVLQNQEI